MKREVLIDHTWVEGPGLVLLELVREMSGASQYFTTYKVDIISNEREFKEGYVNAERARGRWRKRTGKVLSQSDVFSAKLPKVIDR